MQVAGRGSAACISAVVLAAPGRLALAAELIEVAQRPLAAAPFEVAGVPAWLTWISGVLLVSLASLGLWQLRQLKLAAAPTILAAQAGGQAEAPAEVPAEAQTEPQAPQRAATQQRPDDRPVGPLPSPDTAELERTRQALAETQARLAALEQGAQSGFWRWSLAAGRFTVWSPGLERLCGLSSSQIPRSLEDFYLLVHPGDRHYVTAEHEAAIRDNRDLELQFCLVRLDGATRHLILSETAMADAQGRVTHRDATLRDVTEQKRAEDARRKSEAKFRYLAAGSLQGVVIERDLTPLFMNDALADMFDYDSVDEILALGSVLELATPDEQAAIKRRYYANLRGQTAPQQFELLGRKKNGIPIWLDIATRTVSWDGREATQWTIVDITDRKFAEEALRESEARYRSLFDESPVSMWETDWSGLKIFVDELRAQGITDLRAYLEANPDVVADAVSRVKVIDFNRSTLQIYRVSSREALLEKMDQFLADTYWNHMPELISAFAEGETRFVSEGPERTLDGGEILVRITREIPEGYRDDWVRVIQIVEDVTEQKDAETALRQSEARFRDLFDSAPISMWEEDWTGLKTLIDDLRGQGVDDLLQYFTDKPEAIAALRHRIKVLDFNEATAELFGVADKATLWKRLEELLSTFSLQGAAEATAVFTSGATRLVRDAHDRNLEGEPIWVHEAFKLLGSDPDDWSRVIITMENITERKIAEDALQQSEARFRGVIDNSPSAILLKDLDGRYVLVNKQFREWLGRETSEILGKTSLDMFPDEVAACYASLDKEVLQTGRAAQREHPVPFADGATRQIFTTKFPVLDAAGKAIGIGAINTDVTEQRQTEALLRQAQKMEAIGQLTGGVAHDFNNLLAVILGNLELLEEHLEGDGEAHKMLGPSLGAARRGAELTNRLLAFARRQPLEPRAVDLGELIATLTSVLRRTLGEAVEVATRVSKTLWPTLIDPVQMENALLNLAVNARDAMSGGGRLTIAAANVELQERAVRQKEGLSPGRYVKLVVSDTGSGMSPEVARQAFEPFFTTKEVGKGSGLGLSMVYGFAKQSGGHCELESRPGAGTSITLYLPMAKAKVAARVKPSREKPDTAATSEIVLIVEDDPDVRALTARQVMTLGYQVLEAPDGPEALALLSGDTAVDLLLTDVMLPNGMTGVELARKATRLRPQLPVLYMSGYSRDALMLTVGDDSEIRLLDKPFTRADLATKMRESLAQAPS